MLLEVGGVRKGRVPIGKVFIRHNAGSESQKATLNAARSGWGQEGKGTMQGQSLRKQH